MGLMNAIGLQPRHPAPSVTSQGTQTPIIQLQNAETQTERELSEPSVPQPPHTDAPPEAPTSQEAAAGQQAASQSSVQSEASAEDSAPSGGAGTAPPPSPTTSV